jgi:signal transduction histidine kinase
MERLVAVIQELSKARTMKAIQEIVREAAGELTGADGATFVLRDDGRYFYADEDATDTEVRLLRALADSASVALENVKLHAELEATRHELEERKRVETSLRRTEAQLRQSQKMDAVGQLAGGIAHDFNNILSVILSFSSMAAEGLKEGDPLRADLDEIYKAGNRAATLTKRLLTFSRHQLLEPRILDVATVAREMEMMLRRLIGADVELELFTTKAPFPVYADSGAIEEVLLNLVVNARDAMPKGGKLTVEVTNVHLAGEYVSMHLGLTDGDYLMLAVSDTGIGMNKEMQARIFDPFFTTKPKGQGMGLGLSTVYGTIKQSGGHVWVYSEPGEGTTFKVYLPRRLGDPAEKSESVPVVERLTGSETILLVEDDEQVRHVARGILRRNGYHVIEAQNAGDAVLAGEDRRQTIDLLLTDVILPHIGGMQLIDRLTASRPDIKVLCMSGYTGEAAVRHGVVDANIPFVQKPLTPETLLIKVRQVLGRGDPRPELAAAG